MANPAELLHRQFDAWNKSPKGRSVKAHRHLTTDNTHALRQHEIAMGHISSIRELLDTIDQTGDFSIDEFRAELPKWTAITLSYPTGWVANEVTFDSEPLRLLRILWQKLDTYVPAFTPDQIEAVRTALDTTLQLLREDGTIRGQLAIYLTNLLNHARLTLDDFELRGDFELAKAVTLLRETVRTASKASTNKEAKPKWKRMVKILTTPEVTPQVFDMAMIATNMLQRMLPPGAGG